MGTHFDSDDAFRATQSAALRKVIEKNLIDTVRGGKLREQLDRGAYMHKVSKAITALEDAAAAAGNCWGFMHEFDALEQARALVVQAHCGLEKTDRQLISEAWQSLRDRVMSGSDVTRTSHKNIDWDALINPDGA